MMIRIIKYYKIALLPSSLIVFAIEIIWAIVEYDPNYKSEWMPPGFAEIWSIGLVIINALIISILSLTIFFNLIHNIRNSLSLSLITWFIAPMIWIGFFLTKAFLLVLSDNSINGDRIFLLLNSVPYLIGLIWGFIKFRQDLKCININTEKI